MPMRAFKVFLIGLGSSVVWPLYLGLLALLARIAPWPRPLARPVSFVLASLGFGLFAAKVAHFVFRRGGVAEADLGMPAAVARQLRRAILGLVLCSIVLLLPEILLNQGMLAPGGHPVTVLTLPRLLGLGFEIAVWVVAYRLGRRKSALVMWWMECPQTLGWLCRRRRLLAWLLLGAIGAVIGLDLQGYGFTARRLAEAGTQSAILIGLCSAAYALLIQAIDNYAWHWIRPGSAPSPTPGSDAEGLDRSPELARRLRKVTRALVPIVGLLLGAWIWNVDLALFRSIGEVPLWHFSEESALRVGDLALAVAVFSITTAAWIHMSTFFAVAIFPRMPDDPGIRFAVVTLCRYSVLGLGVLAGLSALHLGVERIGMVLAALGVGLGFGLQEIVSNFVSGIILLLERPIRVGDIVTVSGMTGKIDRINIRATTIINSDNQSIIVQPPIHHEQPGELDAQRPDHPRDDRPEPRVRHLPRPRGRPFAGDRPRRPRRAAQPSSSGVAGGIWQVGSKFFPARACA